MSLQQNAVTINSQRGKSLAKRYLTALCLVCALAFAGQALIQTALNRQVRYGYVTKTTGRQRMRIQKIVKTCLASLSPYDTSSPTMRAKELNEYLSEWELIQRKLRNSDKIQKLPKNDRLECLRVFDDVQQTHLAMLREARTLTALLVQPGFSPRSKQAAAITRSMLMEEPTYLTRMDDLVIRMDKSEKAWTFQFRLLEIGLLLLTLLSLALEALFVFRAAIRYAREMLVDLETNNHALEEAIYEREAQQAELEAQQTELEARHQELHDAHEHLQTMFTHIPAACFLCDDSGNLIQWNSAFTELFPGHNLQFQETLLRQLYLPSETSSESFGESMEAVLDGHSVQNVERQLHLPDGSYRQILFSSFCLCDPDGNARQILGCITDISQKHDQFSKLQASEERFRALTEATSNIIWACNSKGELSMISQSGLDFIGLSLEEALNGGWLNAMHPEQREDAMARWNLILANDAQNVDIFELRMLRHDGVYRLLRMKLAVLRGQDGVIREFLGACTDVTEENEAQMQILRSEERFRALVEATSLIICTIDPHGEVTSFSQSGLEFCGYTFDEIHANFISLLFHPEDQEAASEQCHKLLEAQCGIPSDFIYRLRRADGIYRHFKAGHVSIFNKDGSLRELVCSFTDITEEYKAQKQIRISEERFRTLAEATTQIIWTADSSGNITHISEKGLEFTGMDLTTALNGGWFTGIHPDDRERTLKIRNDVIQSEGRDEHELISRLRRADGVYRVFSVRSAAIYNEDGSVREYIGACTDITEKQEALQKLQESEERFRTLVEATTQTILTADSKGIFKHVSQAGLDFAGIDLETALNGGWLTRIHPDDREQVLNSWKKLIANEEHNDSEYSYRLMRTDGVYRVFSVKRATVRNADGSVREYIAACTDITEKQEALLKLQESEERYALALKGSQDGIWDVDLRTNEYYYSDRWKIMLGYPTDKADSADLWQDSVYPEDKEKVQQTAREYLTHKIDVFECEHRMYHQDGSLRWVMAKGAAIFDSNGVATRLSGSLTDITEKKKAELELCKLSMVASKAPIGVIITDAKSFVEWTNEAHFGITGHSTEDMIGKHPFELLSGPNSDPDRIAQMAEQMRAGRPYSAEMPGCRKDGRIYWLSLNFTPIHDTTGELTNYVGLLEDISLEKRYKQEMEEAYSRISQSNTKLQDQLSLIHEQAAVLEDQAAELEAQKSELVIQQHTLVSTNLQLEQANNLLSQLATTDGLTGLMNHRTFQDYIAVQFELAQAEKRPLSVIMFDVDHFKSFNDEYGHQAGDEVLRTIGELLIQWKRPFDTVARYGGEEFIVLLPDTGSSVATVRTEALRHLLASHQWPNRQVTASFGIATLSSQSVDATELIRDSDEALYYSKQNGRNRLTHSDNLCLEEKIQALQAGAVEAAYRDFVGQLMLAQQESLMNPGDATREQLARAYDATISGWARVLDLRDKETVGHSDRVTDLTVRLARMAGLNEEEVLYTRWGAMLHDIGKIGVPDHILLKKGPLTSEEWVVMRSHPVLAKAMLGPIPFLQNSIDIPYCHHERWDGKGYPQGLKGEDIPMAARLFAVVDVWDALRSDRPYRNSWSDAETTTYLKAQAGIQFDARAVRLFLKMMRLQRGSTEIQPEGFWNESDSENQKRAA